MCIYMPIHVSIAYIYIYMHTIVNWHFFLFHCVNPRGQRFTDLRNSQENIFCGILTTFMILYKWPKIDKVTIVLQYLCHKELITLLKTLNTCSLQVYHFINKIQVSPMSEEKLGENFFLCDIKVSDINKLFFCTSILQTNINMFVYIHYFCPAVFLPSFLLTTVWDEKLWKEHDTNGIVRRGAGYVVQKEKAKSGLWLGRQM